MIASVHIPCSSFASGDNPQHTPVGVGLTAKLRSEMVCYALDVLQYGYGIFENCCVDPLENDALFPAAMIKADAVCVVNVSAAVTIGFSGILP